MSKQQPQQEEELDFDQKYVKQYLKTKGVKEYHLNGQEFRGNYKISTGSKIFDKLIDGGFGSGVVRFVGPTESGKTAEALQVLENFLNTVPNSKGILVKAEGRLDENMTRRVNTPFTDDPEKWVQGSCWFLKSNVYEVVFDLLRALVTDPENKVRYCIVIDSMDGLIRKEDLEKSSSQAKKVAGGAVMTSDFLTRTNLYLGEWGHLCIMIAQVRAEIKGEYEAKDRNKLGGASGGNAAVHYPNWVIEFMRPLQGDYFRPDAKAQISTENKPWGRNVTIRICKSTNETTMLVAKYPIRFKAVGKSAIWQEREIIDLLMAWGFFDKRGSWYATEESLTKHLKLDEPMKLQGIEKWYESVESDSDLCNKLSEFVDTNILNIL